MTAKHNHEASGWLVYLNGIEVPAKSVTVSSQVGSIPEARISFPPDVTMRRIGAEDRVRATVFYYDSYYTSKEGKDPDWRLLFDGELVDYGYTNTSQGRQLYYVAVDLVSVLTQVYPIFIASLGDLAQDEYGTAENTASGTINPLAMTYSLFTHGVSDGDTIERPYEFVMNIFNLLLGEGAEGSTRSVISTHWFGRWSERTKMLRRILPSYDIDLETPKPDRTAGFPLLEAAQDETVVTSISKEGDQIANNASYYRLIQTIFQRVYYDFSAVLAPPYVAVDHKTGYPVRPPEDQDNQNMSVEGEEASLRTVLGQHVTKPRNFFGVPPKCNVVWPSMTVQHSYNENYATQPTRTYLGNPFMLELFNQGQGFPELIDNATTVGYPEEAQRALAGRKEGDVKTNINNFLVYPEEFFKGPVYNKLNAPRWFSLINDDKADSEPITAGRIHRLYASMEHYRTRMSKRNGSVTMVFNPYVLTGQPCAIIDEPESNHHVFGHVVSVEHSLSQDNVVTTMNYSYGRTFEEFFETLVRQRAEFTSETMADEGYTTEEGENVSLSDEVIASPIHPIKELRDKFQKYSAADEYYSALFWQNDTSDVVFDWREVVGVTGTTYEDVVRVINEITLDLEDSNAIAREEEGYIPEYMVFTDYKDYANDTRKALEYVYRPVCTLDEYIDFQYEYGRRDGKRLPKNPREGKIAPYYVKILGFVQGPGEEMGQTATGDRCEVIEVDTRRNWETRFLRYRHKVYYEDHPHLA